MKTPDLTKLDQQDFTVLQAQLNLHATRLGAILSAQEGEAIQPPKLIVGGLGENIEALVNHIAELEHRIGASCPQFQFPAGIKTSGEAARPARVPGTSTGATGAGLEPGASSTKKQTLTEKVLAARGVKTLGELTAKMADVPHDEKMQSARKLKVASLIIAFFALAVFNVVAQSTQPFDTTGNHILRAGGTNFISANSADTFADYGLPFPCNSFSECSFGISFSTASPFAGGTATLVVTNGILAADGTLRMESAAAFSQVIPLTSTNLQSVVFGCTNLCGNRFSLALVNTNGVPLTNETVNVLFKLTKRGAVDAAR